MTTHEIVTGDCLSIMKEMESDCVDMVICSPPYENARTYGIEFNLKGQAWVDWALERYIECVRISRGLVVWVIEGKTKNFQWSATPALLMADLHRAGVKLRKPPIFHRVGIAGSGGPDWWRNDYEFCVCSSKGKLPWSDNTANGHPPKWAPGGEMSHRVTNGTRRNQWGHSGTGDRSARNADGSFQTAQRNGHSISTKEEISKQAGYDPPSLANAGNVIKTIVGGGVMGSRLCHENEAPFPEALIDPFIRCFCPPDGIVLDCFAGSGTTASVAKQNGRNSISIDIRDCGQAGKTLIEKRLAEVS